jgi:hypothetical protein
MSGTRSQLPSDHPLTVSTGFHLVNQTEQTSSPALSSCRSTHAKASGSSQANILGPSRHLNLSRPLSSLAESSSYKHYESPCSQVDSLRHVIQKPFAMSDHAEESGWCLSSSENEEPEAGDYEEPAETELVDSMELASQAVDLQLEKSFDSTLECRE